MFERLLALIKESHKKYGYKKPLIKQLLIEFEFLKEVSERQSCDPKNLSFPGTPETEEQIEKELSEVSQAQTKCHQALLRGYEASSKTSTRESILSASTNQSGGMQVRLLDEEDLFTEEEIQQKE